MRRVGVRRPRVFVRGVIIEKKIFSEYNNQSSISLFRLWWGEEIEEKKKHVVFRQGVHSCRSIDVMHHDTDHVSPSLSHVAFIAVPPHATKKPQF